MRMSARPLLSVGLAAGRENGLLQRHSIDDFLIVHHWQKPTEAHLVELLEVADRVP
jgi:hypothetical protein